jgi:hypothetical protein
VIAGDLFERAAIAAIPLEDLHSGRVIQSPWPSRGAFHGDLLRESLSQAGCLRSRHPHAARTASGTQPAGRAGASARFLTAEHGVLS